jgi:hypothetical protein
MAAGGFEPPTKEKVNRIVELFFDNSDFMD